MNGYIWKSEDLVFYVSLDTGYATESSQGEASSVMSVSTYT